MKLLVSLKIKVNSNNCFLDFPVVLLVQKSKNSFISLLTVCHSLKEIQIILKLTNEIFQITQRSDKKFCFQFAKIFDNIFVG